MDDLIKFFDAAPAAGSTSLTKTTPEHAGQFEEHFLAKGLERDGLHSATTGTPAEELVGKTSLHSTGQRKFARAGMGEQSGATHLGTGLIHASARSPSTETPNEARPGAGGGAQADAKDIVTNAGRMHPDVWQSEAKGLPLSLDVGQSREWSPAPSVLENARLSSASELGLSLEKSVTYPASKAIAVPMDFGWSVPRLDQYGGDTRYASDGAFGTPGEIAGHNQDRGVGLTAPIPTTAENELYGRRAARPDVPSAVPLEEVAPQAIRVFQKVSVDTADTDAKTTEDIPVSPKTPTKPNDVAARLQFGGLPTDPIEGQNTEPHLVFDDLAGLALPHSDLPEAQGAPAGQVLPHDEEHRSSGPEHVVHPDEAREKPPRDVRVDVQKPVRARQEIWPPSALIHSLDLAGSEMTPPGAGTEKVGFPTQMSAALTAEPLDRKFEGQVQRKTATAQTLGARTVGAQVEVSLSTSTPQNTEQDGRLLFHGSNGATGDIKAADGPDFVTQPVSSQHAVDPQMEDDGSGRSARHVDASEMGFSVTTSRGADGLGVGAWENAGTESTTQRVAHVPAAATHPSKSQGEGRISASIATSSVERLSEGAVSADQTPKTNIVPKQPASVVEQRLRPSDGSAFLSAPTPGRSQRGDVGVQAVREERRGTSSAPAASQSVSPVVEPAQTSPSTQHPKSSVSTMISQTAPDPRKVTAVRAPAPDHQQITPTLRQPSAVPPQTPETSALSRSNGEKGQHDASPEHRLTASAKGPEAEFVARHASSNASISGLRSSEGTKLSGTGRSEAGAPSAGKQTAPGAVSLGVAEGSPKPPVVHTQTDVGAIQPPKSAGVSELPAPSLPGDVSRAAIVPAAERPGDSARGDDVHASVERHVTPRPEQAAGGPPKGSERTAVSTLSQGLSVVGPPTERPVVSPEADVMTASFRDKEWPEGAPKDAASSTETEQTQAPNPTQVNAPQPSMAPTAPVFTGSNQTIDLALAPAVAELLPVSQVTTVSAPPPVPSAQMHAIAQQTTQALLIRDTTAEGTIEIALDPPELGRLRMGLSEATGTLVLTITADRPETADLMRRHISMLLDEFSRAGLDAPKVNISGEGTSHSQQHAPQRPAEATHGASAEPDATKHLETPQTLLPTTRQSNGGMDLRL